MSTMRTHVPIVLGIMLIAGLAYVPLAGSNYCGFDDTLELQRLTFHDPGTLHSDFRTVLFQSYKYRPLTFTLNRITFRLGNESATFFRVRNVVCHLLIAGLIYGIGLLLFNLVAVAAGAALLFSVHPLANQAVAGSVWVITPADLCLFLSFFLFLVSLRPHRWQVASLIGSLAIGSLGVLIYDPVIVVYGLIFLYFAVWLYLERKLPPRSYLVTLALFTVAFAGLWLGLRARFLPAGAQTPVALSAFVTNLVIYVGGLFQVFDPVLAADVLGTPLPREALSGGFTIEWLVVVTLPAAIMMMVLLFTVERLRAGIERRDLILFLFLVLAWAGSLAPYLFFNSHASETYDYVGLAFALLLAMRVLYAVVSPAGGRPNLRIFAVLVGAGAFFYCAATVDRNLRVKSCGSVVTNIFSQLPKTELQSGQRTVVFANMPYEPQTELYGMYGYKGVHVLGIGEYGSPGIAGALQFAFKNAAVNAETVAPEEFERRCTGDPGLLCFWVHADGSLKRHTPGVAPAIPPLSIRFEGNALR